MKKKLIKDKDVIGLRATVVFDIKIKGGTETFLGFQEALDVLETVGDLEVQEYETVLWVKEE